MFDLRNLSYFCPWMLCNINQNNVAQLTHYPLIAAYSHLHWRLNLKQPTGSLLFFFFFFWWSFRRIMRSKVGCLFWPTLPRGLQAMPPICIRRVFFCGHFWVTFKAKHAAEAEWCRFVIIACAVFGCQRCDVWLGGFHVNSFVLYMFFHAIEN